MLSRWSKLKSAAKSSPTPLAEDAPVTAELNGQADVALSSPENQPPAEEVKAELPNLADLTPESDFKPFMQSGVNAADRNAALKKLFTDPHYNQMDGLDIYIDDYGKPDPIPAEMLKRLMASKFLGLYEEPVKPVESDMETNEDKETKQAKEAKEAKEAKAVTEPTEKIASDLLIEAPAPTLGVDQSSRENPSSVASELKS
jgi:Protein of unknown function (DUF3306)